MQMKRKIFSIGVIGHRGTVGETVFTYFKRESFPVFGYSRHGKKNISSISLEEINSKCDVIFVCVPTPFNYTTHSQDLSVLEDVLRKIVANKIVVIKSTVLPGTTEKLQQRYPQLKLLFNPEFLSRATALHDFQYPDRQILGYTKISKGVTNGILQILPKGKYTKIMKSTEAELIKYAHNIFGALSVVYANHLFDVCQKKDLDYEKIIQAFTALKGMEQFRRYATIYHNHKRGFGGPCFPKDINSFLAFCNSMDVKVELIKAARDANKRILTSQGLTEQSAEAY